MTRKEATEMLKALNMMLRSPDGEPISDVCDALGMAIEALTEPKTIIGIDIPYGSDKGIATLFNGKDDKLILEEVKEIMSVVRCKDCKHYIVEGITTQYGWCYEYKHSVDEDDFCSYGERKK